MENKIATPLKTKLIMERHGFFLKKKYGQNLLIDQNVLVEIVEGADLQKDDIVIEIGPGIGSLTQYLSDAVREVLAIEIDKALIPILNETLSEYNNVSIIQEDILKVDLQQLISERWPGKKVKIVANLPYYITTPIIMKIFEEKIPVESITVMVQKEVAQRMQAKPSTKEYGALSLAVQFYCEPKIIAEVSPSCFIPRPNVGSSVIRLVVTDKNKESVENDAYLFSIIKGAFQQRRKTLVNTLSHQPELNLTKEKVLEVLNELNISPTIRGEALNLEEFIILAKKLKM